ncbi:ATP-binding cassette domain-containing protein [uncultured Acetatifactor sp.]|jgi:putative ABC transport system ATP-binding protein|uniref:ATP-binding cassette domain-containing protein n=1 Tax=uncultured Acetatifactor sp. TaxID=1671927 RepID=UPI00260CE697|nr:ATP-binding cassette domain-containing protein [uncultured Acetatifactor sp.]
MPTLELKNVSYAYEKGREVLQSANAELETGKMYAILGPSGSGKTTLLSLLGGLDTPTQGKVLFDGEDIMAKGLEHHRRNHISLIFQSYNLIDYMTPLENVRLTAKLDAAPILKRLGLKQDEITRNVLKLSGGQQQRAAIARALASDAPVILADEPTGNLDADTAGEITAVLKESAHAFGKCVVVVTHSGEVAKQADVVLEMKRGHLKEREIL